MVGREILGSIKPIFADDSTDTVDLQNFESVAIIWTGSSGDVLESDSSATGYTVVAAANLIQETGGQPQGQPWAVAYKGSKRYLRSVEDAMFILGNPRHVPTYDTKSAVTVRSVG